MANVKESKQVENQTVTVSIPSGVDPEKARKQFEASLRGKIRDEIRIKAERELKKQFQGKFNEIYQGLLQDAGLE